MTDNIEELLKPRFLVIADWPESEFMVGSIIETTPKGVAQLTKRGRGNLESWPHLFKKLEWFEHRGIVEMPEYLMLIDEPTARINGVAEPKIHKVVKHFKLNVWDEIGSNSKEHFVSEYAQYHYGAFLPATKSEYDNYQQTKSK